MPSIKNKSGDTKARWENIGDYVVTVCASRLYRQHRGKDLHKAAVPQWTVEVTRRHRFTYVNGDMGVSPSDNIQVGRWTYPDWDVALARFNMIKRHLAADVAVRALGLNPV